MIPRQGEQCPVVIISYMGYSSPKCTCHGKQSHSSKYMILLECLHAQSHVSSPHQLLHMPKPNASKIQFSKQKLFVLKNTLPSFSKYIGLPSEANFWIIFFEQSWVRLQDELLENYPRQFFGKSSLKFLSQSFSFFFYFPSRRALTPTI